MELIIKALSILVAIECIFIMYLETLATTSKKNSRNI